ncbi:hypothetical protein JHN53_11140 [Streptomyces sp. MBT58]|uniref:hypothetical protein n=1 Tax=Streptomyces sp. MBT58 TaxID=1488389 RepID=UPI00191205AF|nr:hypothetical protein [Streptomyces sp. MBT58]MBK5992187.1 hypothetical protein [Streptomyces sp. MBT58]
MYAVIGAPGGGQADHVVGGEPIRQSIGQEVLAVFQFGTGHTGDVCGFAFSAGLKGLPSSSAA